MRTHLDPAFLEPRDPTPAPVEKDPDTLDIFDLPADEPKTSDDAKPESSLRLIASRRRGGRPEHISRPLARVLSRLIPPPPAKRPAA